MNSDSSSIESYASINLNEIVKLNSTILINKILINKIKDISISLNFNFKNNFIQSLSELEKINLTIILDQILLLAEENKDLKVQIIKLKKIVNSKNSVKPKKCCNLQ